MSNGLAAEREAKHAKASPLRTVLFVVLGVLVVIGLWERWPEKIRQLNKWKAALYEAILSPARRPVSDATTPP